MRVSEVISILKRRAFYLIQAQMPQPQSPALQVTQSARIRPMPSTPPDNIENAHLQWQDSGAPYSTQFDDIYFSREGGLSETEHVFLDGNHLLQRWEALGKSPQAFTIAELGFGTGLNFLCCWREWRRLAPTHLRLHYIACEKYPLQRDALRKALAEWPELTALAEELLQCYPDHSVGYHRLYLSGPHGAAPITLDLYYGNAVEMLAAQPLQGSVDAWFLDGFAPRVNPQMWSDAVLAQVARLSHAGSTLSTYSVAGQVVRGLRAAGFNVEKCQGFGNKRQMLVGHMPETGQAIAPSSLPKPSWFDLGSDAEYSPEVIVIGAGLAGCATAHSLARKGFSVVVLEEATTIASGASGNRQAVLQCRLSNALNGSREFNLQAYLYATREFAHLQREFPNISWHGCGVINLDTAFSARKENCEDVDLDRYSQQVARRLPQEETSDKAGIALDGASNFLPLAGWLDPARLCHAYLQHPNIRLQCGIKVHRLERVGQTWQAFTENSPEFVASAKAVVIANSISATQFSQTAPLSIVPIRGQVSYVRANAQSEKIARVVCGQSYVSPAFEGLHSVGASYSKRVSDLSLNKNEHQQNIAGVATHFAKDVLTEEAIEGGRVSIRATTTDRMPIVGPVPDFAAFEALYTSLGQRDRKHPHRGMPNQAGLFVSVGHGSHGLSNAPLCGEYIASLIAQEALPLQRKAAECIHPGRFFLRQLRRRDYKH